ncbi:MAG: putative membrane protein YphA (DoxX/SURF4 family) [Cyclobacteriaceae bacterium]|jgi:uncharacterized membrane protein YphA (DoxX/SURF4 family)
MNLIIQVARYFTGALFIFSGLIKVNDPVGTAIKMEEYFEVFAYDFAPFFEWFIPFSLPIAVLFVVSEVVLGIALIIGYEMKKSVWALLGLIVFFTFLTFYSAYFNKVTDCGCFGDAIKLTPWESFTKDIILLLTTLIIVWKRADFKSLLSQKLGHYIILGSTVVFLLMSIWAIRHLPTIDFRSYAIGNHLPTLMLPSGELEYEYIMRKDGSNESYTAYLNDPSYEFVAMNVLNPEVQPKITDLSVWNDEGEYTEAMMTGNKLIIITHNISKTSSKHNEEITQLLSTVKGVQAWAFTSSNGTEYREFADDAGWDVPFFYADATVLKTMIRSSPGIFLISDGIVIGKWHHNDTPSASEIHRLL